MNDVTVDDVWNFCDAKQKELEEIRKTLSYNDMPEFMQGKILAYREIQYLIRKKCSKI